MGPMTASQSSCRPVMTAVNAIEVVESSNKCLRIGHCTDAVYGGRMCCCHSEWTCKGSCSDETPVDGDHFG